MQPVIVQSSDPAAPRAYRRQQALAAAVAEIEAMWPSCLAPSPRLLVVVMCGVPGSGKTYLARQLEPLVQATIVETDQIRHRLFRQPGYTATEHAWVYRVCHALIARLLARQRAVIFDATNLREDSRRQLYRIAEAAQAPIVLVHTIAPDDVIRQRLLSRQAGVDAANHSDATVAVYEKLRATEQPIRRPHLVIDTTGDGAESIRRIVHACHAGSKATMKQQESRTYEVVEHTADVALRVWADSLETLFSNAAQAMFAEMTDLAQTPASVRRTVSVEADDNEALLVGWLNELLYLRDVNREIYTRFSVHFPAAGRLEGSAEGGPGVCGGRPIKAATYHDLRIVQSDSGYETTIVFDV